MILENENGILQLILQLNEFKVINIRTWNDLNSRGQYQGLLHITKSMCIAVQLSKFFSTIVNFIMSAF